MSNALFAKLQELIEAGLAVEEQWQYDQWENRAHTFLEHAVGVEDSTTFNGLLLSSTSWPSRRSAQVGCLESCAIKLENRGAAQPPAERFSKFSKRVFVVHGHDNEAKESTARFLEWLGLDAVILHEQPNAGRTLIEKLEDYSDVGFAVVLLTPDDIGAAASDKENLKARARQNVIAELGHFVGFLSRKRVCALHKEGVEIPSDYSGVGYVSMDRAGAWKAKLAQELVSAGLSINIEELLKS